MPPKNKNIVDNDIVSRSIIEPTHIDRYGKLLLNTFAFPDNRPESVNCNRFLNNDIQQIHRVGLQLQNAQRERKIRAGKEPNNTYKGYIEGQVKKIISIKVGETNFNVVYHPENGNDAHCNINIQVGKKSEKALAKERLFDIFSDLISYAD